MSFRSGMASNQASSARIVPTVTTASTPFCACGSATMVYRSVSFRSKALPSGRAIRTFGFISYSIRLGGTGEKRLCLFQMGHIQHDTVERHDADIARLLESGNDGAGMGKVGFVRREDFIDDR